MNRAGPSTDNMKRECRAISAVAMPDQHKRQGHSGVACGVFWGELYVCMAPGGCLCVLRVSICVCVCVCLQRDTYLSKCGCKRKLLT